MTTTHDEHEPCLCGEPTIDGFCPIPECVASSHYQTRLEGEAATFGRMAAAVKDYIKLFTTDQDEIDSTYQRTMDQIIDLTDFVGKGV